jgi:hypothetical protein
MDAVMTGLQLRDGDVLVLKVPSEQFYNLVASGDVGVLEALRQQIQRNVIDASGHSYVGLVVLPDDMELSIVPVRNHQEMR